jgi:hypothetical protein
MQWPPACPGSGDSKPSACADTAPDRKHTKAGNAVRIPAWLLARHCHP